MSCPAPDDEADVLDGTDSHYWKGMLQIVHMGDVQQEFVRYLAKECGVDDLPPLPIGQTHSVIAALFL